MTDFKANPADLIVDAMPEHLKPFLDSDMIASMRAHAAELVEIEVEGFRTERDFCRYACKQIVGMRRDLETGDGETLLKRIMSLEEGARQYLLLYGHGDG